MAVAGEGRDRLYYSILLRPSSEIWGSPWHYIFLEGVTFFCVGWKEEMGAKEV